MRSSYHWTRRAVLGLALAIPLLARAHDGHEIVPAIIDIDRVTAVAGGLRVQGRVTNLDGAPLILTALSGEGITGLRLASPVVAQGFDEAAFDATLHLGDGAIGPALVVVFEFGMTGVLPALIETP